MMKAYRPSYSGGCSKGRITGSNPAWLQNEFKARKGEGDYNYWRTMRFLSLYVISQPLLYLNGKGELKPTSGFFSAIWELSSESQKYVSSLHHSPSFSTFMSVSLAFPIGRLDCPFLTNMGVNRLTGFSLTTEY